MARATRARKNVVESDDDDDESQAADESSEDERPRKKQARGSAAASYSRKGKGKGKAPSPAKGGKGKRRAAVSDDEDDEVLQVEVDDGEEDEDGGDGGGAKKGKDKGAGPDIARYAQQLVRLALFAEASQGTLKREDVNKKILGKDSRAFTDVLSLAQRILRKTFALELVDVRPKGKGSGGADDVAAEADKLRAARQSQAQAQGQKGKKAPAKGKGGKKRRKGDESASDEEDEDEPADVGAANGRVSNRKKTSGPVRAYMLRSLLPQPLIAAVAVPSPPQDPATSHGAGAVPSGPILDFDKDGAMALMGVLYVVLALILVNGRRLPDDHLKSYLKQLGLHPSTRLPSGTTTSGQPLTVEALLVLGVRHAYLERGKAAKGVFGASQAPGAGGASGGGRGRGKGRAKEDEGEEDVVWAWGARAETEITEKALTELVGDLYLGGGGIDGEDEDVDPDESREERKKRRERRANERERLRKDVRRAAGGELGGQAEDDE